MSKRRTNAPDGRHQKDRPAPTQRRSSPQPPRLYPMEVLTTTDIGSIDRLAAGLGIPPDDGDFLIFGDGSGSGWSTPMGWACVVCERKTGRRKAFWGAASAGSGSVYHAEILAFFHAIGFIVETVARQPPAERPGLVKIHIITDSDAVATAGNSLMGRQKTLAQVKAAGPLWAAIAQFERQGLEIRFHWAERLHSALNSYADDLAGTAARAIRDLKKPCDHEGNEVSIYDCNPAGDYRTVVHRLLPREPKRRKKPAGERPCSTPECA
jgi:ribonuclease HI